MSTRIEREKRVVALMIHIYCRGNGHTPVLCDDCKKILEYAHQRLSRCPFGEKKSTCRLCKVHCYRSDMKERMKMVMRYAGPRMLWSHPLSAFRHFWDER
jgi:predicted amidophosphoribosyltransferase